MCYVVSKCDVVLKVNAPGADEIKSIKKDAVLIRKIIEGLRSFTKEGIDTSNYNRKELLNKLRELNTADLMS